MRILFTLFIGIAISAVAVHASPLDEVFKSDRLEKMDRQTRLQNVRNMRHGVKDRWINPDSSFGKLFVRSSHAQDVIDWLTSNIDPYKVKRAFGAKGKVFASAEAKLRMKNEPAIWLNVLVPHPKYVEMMRYGLIPDFNELTPPSTQTAFSDQIDIQQHQAHLYKMKSGQCRLIIDAARYSKIALRQRECDNLLQLVDLAKRLDFIRYRRKLGEEPVYVKSARETSALNGNAYETQEVRIDE